MIGLILLNVVTLFGLSMNENLKNREEMEWADMAHTKILPLPTKSTKHSHRSLSRSKVASSTTFCFM